MYMAFIVNNGHISNIPQHELTNYVHLSMKLINLIITRIIMQTLVTG